MPYYIAFKIVNEFILYGLKPPTHRQVLDMQKNKNISYA